MLTENMAKISPECLSLVEGTAHTLIAGTTGSGKSVLLNTILYSIIKNNLVLGGQPYEFVFIDTKRVELKQYKNLPYTSIYTTEPEDVPKTLDVVIEAMDMRYQLMERKETTEPYIYVVIDELADLLTTKGVLERIVKIGRLGRAAHIHLIMCTQDPSRTTLTAQIMQNMTTCVALRCKDQIESKQIIGSAGAEGLPKHGKAIVSTPDGYKVITVPLTPDDDIDKIVALLEDWKAQGGGYKTFMDDNLVQLLRTFDCDYNKCVGVYI